jgi:5-oxoprolinase (ATP-hydrolysing)
MPPGRHGGSDPDHQRQHPCRDGQPAMSVEQVAMGFIQVANETMVRPIREISVMRGFDIKEHMSLATFGGAGAQHACAIARALGIAKIFIHRFSGILSAYGIGLADVVAERQQPAAEIYQKGSLPKLLGQLKAIQADAEKELSDQGFSDDQIRATRYLNLRYQGTDTALMIPEPPNGDFMAAFKDTYRREFGFDLEDRDILVDDLRVRARGAASGLRKVPLEAADKPAVRVDLKPCYFEDGWRETAVYQMADLKAGHAIDGPAIIIQDTATIVVEPDCQATVSRYGDIEIQVGESSTGRISTRLDPVQLSIFSNLFMSIAEQMGRMLQKTAISTNIKERLDFSCAMFGSGGDLVANAPHLPVHLGAMSAAVKEQIRRKGNALKPGDVLVSNHPAAGGSHLPDITVITPVFRQGAIIFWVASRGHHADIGGISPGSMPPNSRRIEEEGACITSFKLVADGIFPGSRHHRPAAGSGPPHPPAGTPGHLRNPPAGGQHFRPQGPGGRQPERHRAGTGNGRALRP